MPPEPLAVPQPDILGLAASLPPLVTAVAHPCDELALAGALAAAERGLIRPILVGPTEKIRRLADESGLDLAGATIDDVPHSHAAAARAVELVRRAEAGGIMKGSLHSDELLGEIVKKDTGLRTARRISHVFVMQVPGYDRLLLVTDAAVNIDPSLEDKADIVQNAIDLGQALGIARPRVAILSAVETVTSKLRSTLDAAALCKMADRRQITGGLLDGPLAFDNAVSLEAARTKGIVSEVAGRADILVAPDLESGNILAKQLEYFSGATAGGIVLGARVPVILSSRADSLASRVLSAAVAVIFAGCPGAAGLYPAGRRQVAEA
jgi:phosphate acetyltransferase